MARSANQKLKLLYLMRYLLRNSDENHPVTVRQMGEYLRGQGISAERKSLYDDIEALQQFGLDIIQVKDGNFYGYYVGSRDFELPELKLLVDSVQSSKFITHKKTRSLIEKIERLGSVHEADQLRRQDAAHDVVVAHAVSCGELVAPAGHAVALTENCKSPDVRLRVVYQHAVHIEKDSFQHRVVNFGANVMNFPLCTSVRRGNRHPIPHAKATVGPFPVFGRAAYGHGNRNTPPPGYTASHAANTSRDRNGIVS